MQHEEDVRIEFNQEGTFQAMYAAEAWCREKGISFGQSCATGPTGLLFGQYEWIAKWRNLTTLWYTLLGSRRSLGSAFH